MTNDPTPYRCDEHEARDLTEQIKGSVEKTWRLLLNAHEWQAWAALGYRTWEFYVRAEFGIGRSHSYRLLDQAQVVRQIETAAMSPMGDTLTEREARDLKPHLAEVTDAVREAVADVPEDQRPAAAAAALKQVREKHRPAPPSPPVAPDGEGLAHVTTTTRTTEATKVEHDVDLRTGEVVGPAPADTPHNPVAAARAEVARQPVIVAEKAIDRLRIARLTFEAAGTAAEIVADLANSSPDTDNTGFWLEQIDAALPVLNDLATALRRRNLRSVK